MIPKSLYEKIDRPSMKNSWEKFNQTLELLPNLDTRKVLRITLMRDLNMTDVEGYANLIKKANPDFVEVKAYMWVGYSKFNLDISSMPLHSEVVYFSKKICEATDLEIVDEKENSRVVLLSNNNQKRKLKS